MIDCEFDAPVSDRAGKLSGQAEGAQKVVDRRRIARRSPQLAVDFAMAEVERQHRGPTAQRDRLARQSDEPQGTSRRAGWNRPGSSEPAGRQADAAATLQPSVPARPRIRGREAGMAPVHQLDHVERGAVERDRPSHGLGARATDNVRCDASSRATRCAPDEWPMSTTRDPSPPQSTARSPGRRRARGRRPRPVRAGWAGATAGSSARRRCSRGAASASPCSPRRRYCPCRRASRPRRGP